MFGKKKRNPKYNEEEEREALIDDDEDEEDEDEDEIEEEQIAYKKKLPPRNEQYQKIETDKSQPNKTLTKDEVGDLIEGHIIRLSQLISIFRNM